MAHGVGADNTQIKEQTFKKIEVRLNDIIRLEESIRQLNTLMLTTAAHVDIHVRTPCVLKYTMYVYLHIYVSKKDHIN